MVNSRTMCSYQGCKNSKGKNPALTFHRFPSDAIRCSEWVTRAGNTSLQGLTKTQLDNKRLCSLHFTDDDVMYTDLAGNQKLKKSAIPKENVVSAIPEGSQEVYEHVTHEIDQHINDNNVDDSLLNLDLPQLINIESTLIDLNEPTCSTSYTSSSTNVREVNRDIINDVQLSQNSTLTRAYNRSLKKLEEEVALLKKELLKKDENCKKSIELVQKAAKAQQIKHKSKVISYQKILKSKTKKISNLNKKIEQSKESEEFIQNFQKLNEKQLEFFQMQTNHVKRRKWTEQEKQFALQLFYTSPKAYGFLRDKQKFSLPCITNIRKWVNEIDIAPGKSETLSKLLKAKAESMSAKERECVLMWDEMSIKKWLDYNSKKDYVEGFTDLGEHGRKAEAGNHVLVFMLRGRQYDWRQPIAYYVSHNACNGTQLNKIILDILDYVEATGFKVKSMVCDGGTPNRSAIKMFQITKEKPFIERYGRKIFFNYDAPHLLKCLRNNFKTHDFKSDGCTVSWDALRELHAKEEFCAAKAAPKLTRQHLDPNPFEVMRVSLAAQIFSNTVSSALLAGSLVTNDKLNNPYSVSTGNFIKKVNDLFDCLNSRSPKDRNPLRRPLSDKNSNVVQYLKNSLEWIKTWNCEDLKTNPPCFDGFYLTVNSILLQWEDMKENGGFYLLTSRLNQDPLENLFAVLRARSGHNQNPTAMQLRRNLQYTITANIRSPSKSTNCEPDGTVALLATEESETITDRFTDSIINAVNESDLESNPAASNEINVLSTSNNISCAETMELSEVFEDNGQFSKDNDSDTETASFSEVEDSIDFPDDEVLSKEMHNLVENHVETLNHLTSSSSSIENHSDRVNSVLNNITQSATLYDCSVKYVAGYIAAKCFSKFKCIDCSSALTRENKNFECSNDLLIFFKAFKTFGGTNQLGNLCVPSDFFNNVITVAYDTFNLNFLRVCHEKKIAEKLIAEITLQINALYPDYFGIDGPCKSHRERIIAFFVRVHIFYKLKWINWDARDAKTKKRSVAGNKPNAKLQKLSHQ